MHKGTMYIISAPSGTGKSSLIHALLKTQDLYNIQVSISHTTRSMRPGEINGQHYHFISLLEFKCMIANDKFLEYAQIFDHYYGTSYKTIEQILFHGMDILLDIDWQGTRQVQKKIPEAQSIFILPPSKKELAHRLRKRGQDNEENIYKRMAQAVNEISHFSNYDYLVINNHFNNALSDLKAIIKTEQLRLKKQMHRYDVLINSLLTN